MVVQVRTTGATAPTAAALRDLVHALDPQLPPAVTATLEDDMRIVLLPAQAGAALLGSFGLLALMLASTGIYGVASYSVAQRTREIGVRAALGATSRDVMRLVLAQSMRTVAVGLILGLAAALGLARIVASQLYGVGAADPATFGLTPLVLISVALVAVLVPARRATRVDPMVALRSE